MLFEQGLKLGSSFGNLLLKISIQQLDLALRQLDFGKIFCKPVGHMIERECQITEFTANH